MYFKYFNINIVAVFCFVSKTSNTYENCHRTRDLISVFSSSMHGYIQAYKEASMSAICLNISLNIKINGC